MNYPKLRNPLLCRLTPYAVVLGVTAIPIVAVFLLPVPETLRIVVIFAAVIGFLIYLFCNFAVLIALDMFLAQLCCLQSARTHYSLSGRSGETILKKLKRFGRQYDPSPVEPRPVCLGYRFSAPISVYTSGIERIVTAYETDMLTRDTYSTILRSAKANSKALMGKKKALFLDSSQKKSPLNRITVVVILAKCVDPRIQADLYKMVCSNCGNEETDCILPCIVDLSGKRCTFNCLRVPYIGFSYAVKNRGIRLVKKLVFGGSLPLKGNAHYIESMSDVDPDRSVWALWKDLRAQFTGAEDDIKATLEAMEHGQIRIEEDLLYLKWEESGICLLTEMDKEGKNAKLERIANWAYPKNNPIGKKVIFQLETHIIDYFSQKGVQVQFVDGEELMIFE